MAKLRAVVVDLHQAGVVRGACARDPLTLLKGSFQIGDKAFFDRPRDITYHLIYVLSDAPQCELEALARQIGGDAVFVLADGADLDQVV